jgi:hypothetical protein
MALYSGIADKFVLWAGSNGIRCPSLDTRSGLTVEELRSLGGHRSAGLKRGRWPRLERWSNKS